MTDVHLRGEQLDALLALLGGARRSLDAAAEAGRTAGGACGHDGLSDAVDDVAGGWRLRRAALLDQVAVVHDGLEAIIDTFADLDARMGEAVTSEVPR
ncbi:hypothetical protein OVN18_01405 [Microcella daejeonensis]|uniref:Excreted virulence factor EspC (Type VII ESX diderm) n=1 Tax=Microcella daejeonensis TaxID=2994971 RepID=A0A9E8MLK0_9MICO|nr:hypothetical protein [Microcella daejeonensis]WAB81704.1 hypothetical protein OVN18_01405 [Microcella daejeonensis]WAB83856.1 hypothetical protein OVN20_12620 [Microcella daejeonensis]